MDINVITVSGRLTADAIVKQTSIGFMIKFSIASNRRVWKEGSWSKTAYFFPCIFFLKNIESFKNILKKGNKVAASGHLRNESYTDRSGAMRIVATIMVDCLQPMDAQDAKTREVTSKTHNELGEEIEFMEDIPI